MVRRRKKSPQKEESSQTDSAETEEEPMETKDKDQEIEEQPKSKTKKEQKPKIKQKTNRNSQSQQNKEVETTYINPVQLIRSKLQGVANDLRTFTDDINQIVNLVNTIEQVGPLIQDLNEVQSQSSGDLDLETALAKSNLDLSKLLNEASDDNEESNYAANNSQSSNQQMDKSESSNDPTDDSSSNELDESELSNLLAKMISQKLDNN